MIQAVLRVVAPAGKREEILQVFGSLSGPTEVTKGCRFCRVLCDADDDNAITYWAQWETREDLEDHFRSERFRRLLPYIDMSLEPPDVDVSDVRAIGGIELVLSVIGAQRQ